jgi:hypothetical protein
MDMDMQHGHGHMQHVHGKCFPDLGILSL